MSIKKAFLYSFTTLVLFIVPTLIAVSVRGITTSEETFFSQNDILFYDPSCEGGSDDSSYTLDELTLEDLAPLSGNERLRLIVEHYGEFAMQLQKYYGVPWEMPFAVMVYESQVGADHSPDGISYKAEQAGFFNTMGLTLYMTGSNSWVDDHYDDESVGPLCTTISGQSNCFNYYKTISKQLLGYFIYHARNGHSPETAYDKGLKLLEPDNYRLEEAILALMDSYCVGGCYQNEIMSVIRTGDTSWTGLLDVVREKGWKNSEELAKEWNIQPGGIATEKWGWGDIREEIWQAYGEAGLPSNTSSNTSTSSTDSEINGNAAIVKKAKELSWPEGKRPSDILFANDAYNEAAKKWGGQFITASDCNLSSLQVEHPGLQVCPSCARFVSMVIMESGIDSDFTAESEGGKAHLLSMSPGGLTYYLKNSEKWTEVEDYDGRGYDKLQPGDILIADQAYRPSHIKVDAPYSDHTFIYLGDGKVAEASNKHAGGFQYSWSDGVGGPNDGYVAFRFASNCTQSDITWENGWITGGIDGYVKNPSSTTEDDAWQTQFLTNSPATGAVGPNKITLHTLEGAFSNASENATNAYGGETSGFPPHFTIDIKRKHVWQHFPITKPSCAIKTHDSKAGVQIEIMGYSSASAAADKGQSDWLLSDGSNFSSDDWMYLGELLRGISAETGIPLTISVDTSNPSRLSAGDYQSYEGILGHIHAPDNDHGDPASGVWPFIEDAIGSSTSCYNNRPKSCQVDNKSWTGDFPVWGQGDKPWGDYQFSACGSMSECGCGVVSFAMMATVLDGVEHDPIEVGKVVDSHGLMVEEGSSWDLPTVIAGEFGLVAEKITVDEATASRYLREGWMIWTCGQSVPGLFSNNGHCIGLRGITNDGKWLLADSGNTANMAIDFEPSVVLTGIYNDGAPMVALKKKGK